MYGCVQQVGPSTTFSVINCDCMKMSGSVKTYASGFTMPKINTIHFKQIFTNFSSLVAANPAVLATVFSILLIYVLLLMWARHVDKKDIKKVSVHLVIEVLI